MDRTDNRRTLDDLTRRLALLEDDRAIRDVLLRYAHGLDYGDEADWLDCFTSEAVWEARNTHTGDLIMRHVGADELRAFVSGHTRAPELFHKHLVAEPRVHIDTDRATAVSYLVLLVAAPGAIPVVASFGRYRDKLVRDADGRWRIAVRRVDAEAWNPMWGELRERRRERLSAGRSATDDRGR